MLLMEQKGWVVEARQPAEDLVANLGSRQSKNRDEKYLLWTLFRKQNVPDSLPRFGAGLTVDWHELAFTHDHQ